MIKKYKKKPVIIEAIQFDGTNFNEIDRFVDGVFRQNCGATELAVIKTFNSYMVANINDYIIKDVAGELYICNQDTFNKTYEELSDDER